jgi:tellurite resistance protein TerC
MIAIDLKVGSAQRHMTVRTAVIWSGIWVALAIAFGAALWALEGAEAGEVYSPATSWRRCCRSTTSSSSP